MRPIRLIQAILIYQQTLSTPHQRRGFSHQNQQPNQHNNMANIKPLGQRVLVKRIEADAISAGGIVLPDTAKEKPQEGKVVAVGSGRLLDDGKVKALEIKSGDRVLYGKYSGTEVSLEGDEYLILREEDVLAVVQS